MVMMVLMTLVMLMKMISMALPWFFRDESTSCDVSVTHSYRSQCRLQFVFSVRHALSPANSAESQKSLQREFDDWKASRCALLASMWHQGHHDDVKLISARALMSTLRGSNR